MECSSAVPFAGASIPLSLWCIFKISPYFHKIYKLPAPIFVQFTCFCLNYVCPPLFWPWCIYALCFARTGRLWRPSLSIWTWLYVSTFKSLYDSIMYLFWGGAWPRKPPLNVPMLRNQSKMVSFLMLSCIETGRGFLARHFWNAFPSGETIKPRKLTPI